MSEYSHYILCRRRNYLMCTSTELLLGLNSQTLHIFICLMANYGATELPQEEDVYDKLRSMASGHFCGFCDKLIKKMTRETNLINWKKHASSKATGWGK